MITLSVISRSRYAAASPLLAQRVLDDRKPAVVLQLLHRQVDRQPQHHVQAMPLHHLPACVAQHARAERLDHPRFLGDWDELVGAITPRTGSRQRSERLDAARAPRLHLDLRLVDEEELVVHQPATHVGFELQPQLHARVHVGREEPVCIAPGVLRRVHRGVRLLDQTRRRRRRRPGYIATPIEQVSVGVWSARRNGAWNASRTRVQHRHHFEGRLRRVEAGRITTNSSPPRRATVSDSRTAR